MRVRKYMYFADHTLHYLFHILHFFIFQAISVTFYTFSGKHIFPVRTGKCSPPLTVMLP